MSDTADTTPNRERLARRVYGRPYSDLTRAERYDVFVRMEEGE